MKIYFFLPEGRTKGRGRLSGTGGTLSRSENGDDDDQNNADEEAGDEAEDDEDEAQDQRWELVYKP